MPYNSLIHTEELQMTKVVYNACYGGFGLSIEAMDRMVELGYEGLELNPGYNPNSKSMYSYKYYGDYNIPRHDPILVQVVEELGEKANGNCADLQIEEVYGPYRIDEYDGNESVKTPTGYDWVTP
jgi:hypothetical protein